MAKFFYAFLQHAQHIAHECGPAIVHTCAAGLVVGRVFEHAGFLVPVSLQQLRGDFFSVRFDDVQDARKASVTAFWWTVQAAQRMPLAYGFSAHLAAIRMIMTLRGERPTVPPPNGDIAISHF